VPHSDKSNGQGGIEPEKISAQFHWHVACKMDFVIHFKTNLKGGDYVNH
jgi:hypothetical protein